ncbi:MAG: 50S ribosomal protein L14e, partial [Candidatus Thorarchaeota archaeon]
MGVFEVGRVCVKTMGRETGSYCVIVDRADDNFVTITGPKPLSSVRRRRCNIKHLEPLDIVISISSGADDDSVMKAVEQAGLTDRF